jgi:hypothetical protein
MSHTNLHQEHHFEAEICQHLAANGWLCVAVTGQIDVLGATVRAKESIAA